MNFTEIIFLPFLFIVLTLERGLAKLPRAQTWMLLLFSILFYGWWDMNLLPLILFVSIFDYVAGQAIARSEDPGVRKRWLVLSMTCSLGTLAYFKYSNFAIHTYNDVASALSSSAVAIEPLKLILPVGISFYTFQSMSYTIDVYRRELAPDRNLPRYLAFVTLFPQLVAGPIVRAAELLPQLQDPRLRRYDYTGVFMILIGFAKKMFIADPLGALLVDPAFADPASKSAAYLWLAAYGYAFQIFCDFSGYSDIAIGIGRLLGYQFPKNFNAPYLAVSVTDFWRRWHITLSTWFRDYLYIPLGGNRGSRGRWFLASMAVFTLSGLWHGANFTFVIWGLIHGVVFVIERLIGGKGTFVARRVEQLTGSSRTFYRVIRWGMTLQIVTIAWVFFRAPTLDGALTYLQLACTGLGAALGPLAPGVAAALGAAALLHFTVEPVIEKLAARFGRLPTFLQAAAAMVLAVAVYANAESALAHRAFIYFQF